ncbi:MAG: hypothetical protein A2W61_00885 [Deltaproteobacteria bacterium RIFCSPLOWO2_01_44_7]|nr:MAG: hypothetical protein A2712_06490 [Deltaproteobacteria bacterium RIFCSPHIGHO2_01_FULL_43_49]OGQ15603.1 MAG: hypothetical protein A3D22_05280 [Deltaproteobacteria bacterium RIFCSPHIGHO2_02_FULL_44_53]OGQ28306.1 MAG: hypothetical protein A3D98_00945 [Deltaproteobacteria bacterium RIFCSPHIGHO2_12_FULL_44_21]OGQ31893.1 MAG: hypothetical protein A2979_02220 [Deltaproteobacteria bacterium RIFCSPLOWO2_01_FULL_45_74]OGQ38266.1 MAG: hypothetical protein A2W61_00885 [Deltaproteobacteria bacterium 
MKLHDFRALSKALSEIENSGPQSLQILKDCYAAKKGAPILGVTGLPGAGKSTLVDHLIQHLRGAGKTVGVIAIDPSSPFTGGALLGDRVRMQRHASDEGVFIRSLGSRGSHGGLSRATRDLTVCLDAYGFDEIIIETVGVGQTELDIMGLATTTVVVLVPESGDAVQTIKAGLTEIADIFVVNKADRQGADGLQKMLQAMVDMDNSRSQALTVTIPVLLTQANQGIGVQELWRAVLNHRKALQKDSQHEKRQQTFRCAQFLELCGEAIRQQVESKLLSNKKWKDLVDQVASGKTNPYEALEKVLKYFQNVAGDGIDNAGLL